MTYTYILALELTIRNKSSAVQLKYNTSHMCYCNHIQQQQTGEITSLAVYFIYSIVSRISFQCVISISKYILPQYSNLIKNSVPQLQLHFKCSVATWLVVILS